MKPKTFFIILLLAGTVVSTVAATILYAGKLEAERDASVALANLAASLDTIRRYQDDSTTTASLMAFQDSVNQDSLIALGGSLSDAIRDRNQTLQALSTLRVEFASLRDQFVSIDVEEHPEEPGAEEASFEIEGPPIFGDIGVIYRPADPWTLRTNLSVTPFRQVYDIGCDEMRRALVNVTTPEWVRVTLEKGVIMPDVCNPLTIPTLKFTWGKAVWFGGGMLSGFLLANLIDDGFRVANYDY